MCTKRDQQQNEPARTFVTFRSSGSPQGIKTTSLQSRSTATGLSERGSEQEEKQREVTEPIVIVDDDDDDDLEIPYPDSGNLVLDRSQKSCHTRQNSNLSTATIPLDELESERQDAAKFKAEDARFRSNEMPEQTMEAGSHLRQEPSQKPEKWEAEKGERTNSREMDGSVVNEVLVKNLQFKQDLPADPAERSPGLGDSFGKIIEHVAGQQRPIAFHNVLCDNYENVRNARFKESKVYVTKEEMERQRLMELLRKGDYESVKAVSDQFHLYYKRILCEHFPVYLQQKKTHCSNFVPHYLGKPNLRFIAAISMGRFVRIHRSYTPYDVHMYTNVRNN
ncbi:hypothetical protein WN51_03611 [Melipona quadrifasciata]|uniref:Uncharacterized protein n=1 Tax=Melipona quadrifasciata TaxID=166423 RepID=A0A0M8ZTW8_9HYME|nr:hypothetical protein WN51_03611 [Melipona quadrifasciata]